MIKALVFDAYGTLYDVQSVAAAAERAFPGRGGNVTQVWRLKQLEYSWLRSMMGRYADLRTVTRESLAYTVATLGLDASPALLDGMAEAYDELLPYPDAEPALVALASYRLAILSNGSPAMLAALTRRSGLDRYLEAVLSVDGKRCYKPDPRAYAIVKEQLGVRPDEVLFVSSNGFDVAGATSFGFRVARIERLPAAAIGAELMGDAAIGSAAMFRILRSQTEALGYEPAFVVGSLAELPGLVARLG